MTLKNSGETLVSNNIEVAHCGVGSEIEICLSESGVIYPVKAMTTEST